METATIPEGKSIDSVKKVLRPLLLCLAFGISCFTRDSWAAAKDKALQQARSLLARGQQNQALKVLRAAVDATPLDFDARMLLGTTLAIEGSRTESIQQITEAIKIRPDSGEAYNLMGTTLSRFLEIEGAKVAFEHAIQLNPHLADAHVNLALLLAQSNEWDGAGKHLDLAISIQNNQPVAAYSHYLRAKIFIAQSQFPDAEHELKQAVRIRDNFAEAWSELGWIRRMRSDNVGAQRAFKKAFLQNPKDPTIRYRLGTAYLRQGDLAHAVSHLRAAYKLGSTDKSTLYNLELALRKSGRPKEAKKISGLLAAQRVASHQSSENAFRVTALNADAMQLEKQGDFDGASLKYRTALELDPTAEGVRLNYGLSLCRLRRWKDGISEIREVLRINPDNGDAAKALYIAEEQARADSTATVHP